MVNWNAQLDQSNFAIKNLMIVEGKVYLTFIPIAFGLESPSFSIPKILTIGTIIEVIKRNNDVYCLQNR